MMAAEEPPNEPEAPPRRTFIAPHNLEAEESLLGAMLLSREAVRAALDAQLAPADFYKPAHGTIFAAMASLHAREAPIDPTTLAGELGPELLERVGGRPTLVRVQVSTPASANAAHYAQLVGEEAARRRALEFAERLRVAAIERDDDALLRLARSAEDLLASPAAAVEPAIDVADLVADVPEDRDEDWAMPGLLARGEVAMVTADPGKGKTTLLRQLGMQAALGRHPWNRATVEPRRVLYLDLQDPKLHVQKEFRRFLAGPGRAYQRGSGMLVVKSRQQGIDLTTARDMRWVDSLCQHHRPDLLIIGPIYRAYRGTEAAGKSSEEAADATTDCLSKLMARWGLGLLLEGHAPHDGAKLDYRPRGSKVWQDWPTFGFGLAPVRRRVAQDDGGSEQRSVAGNRIIPKCRLVAWRGLRDRDRPWPDHLVEEGFLTGGWPWVPPDDDPSTLVPIDQKEMVF